MRESSELARREDAGWRPLDQKLPPETQAWVTELRRMFRTTNMTVSRFAHLHQEIDKGTLSRYLNGKRVPRDRWLVDRLLEAQASANGVSVTERVREHVYDLQLQALSVAHPHEYKIRLVRDELELAVTRLNEGNQYAANLEEQLAERTLQVEALEREKQKLAAGWAKDRESFQAELDRLKVERDSLRHRLQTAHQYQADAEQSCQRLEAVLEVLHDSEKPDTAQPPTWTWPLTADDVRDSTFAVARFRPGYDEKEVDEFLDRLEEVFRSGEIGRFRLGVITADELKSAQFTATGPGRSVTGPGGSVRGALPNLRPGYLKKDVDEFLGRVEGVLRLIEQAEASSRSALRLAVDVLPPRQPIRRLPLSG
ncbi:DivIVA domain-containing protein [Actinomadura barringtoniae]|uniref:DivIVA domain-containing protein n=1 Tax=Actinomadura barringtoniae TaxID=1427535 RepID=A0A939P6R1_9ACTN|nr:DivIVA domain-containing protein [Actinomadura barringtoniae]MBO2445982.1 DivIVA domain-containing protein [Actinomadura barringtoniae]